MLTEIQGNAPAKQGGKTVARTTAKSRHRRKPKGVATKTTPIVVIDSDYMTTGDAAAYVKMSRQFLEGARYRGDGSGPPYIKIGRSVRYRRSKLDAWMTAHDHAADEPI